jgi:hypothetical protein
MLVHSFFLSPILSHRKKRIGFFSFFWYYEGKRGEDLEAKVFDRMPQREVGLFRKKKRKKKEKRVHEGP